MVKHKTVFNERLILSEKYVSALLIFLFNNKNVHTSDLKNISSYYQGIVKKAEELQNIGLIEIEEQNKPFRKKTFRLTDDGKIVAEKLNEIEDDLKDIIDKNSKKINFY